MQPLGYNHGMEHQQQLPTNQKAPDFTLLDLDGESHSLHEYEGQVVILNFWSAECPWSQRSDEKIIDYLHNWDSGVQYLPIASNANEGQQIISAAAKTRQLPLILRDPDHQVADLFGAATTPHLFVIDADGILRYQGAFNDVTFRQPEPTINFLFLAVDALRAGALPDPAETLAYGCAIVRALP
jgi:peroxiredoxin